MTIQPGDFQVQEGHKVELDKWPTEVQPAYPSTKIYQTLLDEQVDELSELQRLLYASNRHAVLLIFQAMDAAGKDGAIRHVMSGVNPQGCQVFSFKHPSAAELEHHVERAFAVLGEIVQDRDVLVMKALGEAGLAHEPRVRLGVIEDVRTHHLYDAHFIEVDMAHLVDGAHSPVLDLRQNLVTPVDQNSQSSPHSEDIDPVSANAPSPARPRRPRPVRDAELREGTGPPRFPLSPGDPGR